VGQKNPTPTPSVVRNPTPAPPKNLRHLTTPQPCITTQCREPFAFVVQVTVVSDYETLSDDSLAVDVRMKLNSIDLSRPPTAVAGEATSVNDALVLDFWGLRCEN